MTPDELLAQLPHWMGKGAAAGRGGVCLIRIDRAKLLRDQLGFTALSALCTQIHERIDSYQDSALTAIGLDWASIVVVLHDIDGDKWAASLEHFRDQLMEGTYRAGGDKVSLTFSIASARFDHRFTNPDELLLTVTHGVEAIEEEGGNQHADLLPGVSARKAMKSKDHMLGLLMEALGTGSIKVVFQHLLASDNAEPLESYQMLPRLQTSDGTLITAGEFLPLARDAALLPVLDRWMMQYAVRLLRGPFSNKPVRLFINQSDLLLRDKGRFDWLDKQLDRLADRAGRVVIEIRLEDAMNHLGGALRLIELADGHDASVCISMVDEHSRWSLLNSDLKCGFIRMSAGFVARLTRERALEKRFMELSQPLRAHGTRIIMPMIEDPETAASMWRSGADFMQGNLIQAPEDRI